MLVPRRAQSHFGGDRILPSCILLFFPHPHDHTHHPAVPPVAIEPPTDSDSDSDSTPWGCPRNTPSRRQCAASCRVTPLSRRAPPQHPTATATGARRARRRSPTHHPRTRRICPPLTRRRSDRRSGNRSLPMSPQHIPARRRMCPRATRCWRASRYQPHRTSSTLRGGTRARCRLRGRSAAQTSPRHTTPALARARCRCTRRSGGAGRRTPSGGRAHGDRRARHARPGAPRRRRARSVWRRATASPSGVRSSPTVRMAIHTRARLAALPRD